MRVDIRTRSDIELLVDTFYKSVLKDELIGSFFTEVIALDFEKHMPTMYDFWEMAVLDKMVYKGNPMLKHISLDKLSPLDEEHFDRWISIFSQTLDQLFEGPNANKAKQKAQTMKSLMLHKINLSRGRNFIQ